MSTLIRIAVICLVRFWRINMEFECLIAKIKYSKWISLIIVTNFGVREITIITR